VLFFLRGQGGAITSWDNPHPSFFLLCNKRLRTMATRSQLHQGRLDAVLTVRLRNFAENAIPPPRRGARVDRLPDAEHGVEPVMGEMAGEEVGRELEGERAPSRVRPVHFGENDAQHVLHNRLGSRASITRKEARRIQRKLLVIRLESIVAADAEHVALAGGGVDFSVESVVERAPGQGEIVGAELLRDEQKDAVATSFACERLYAWRRGQDCEVVVDFIRGCAQTA